MSSNDELTRRDFVAMTVAGIAVAAGADVSAQNVTEKTVEIKTPANRRKAVESLAKGPLLIGKPWQWMRIDILVCTTESTCRK